MRRTVLLFALVTVFIILFAPRALAQEKTPVKVKNSETITGVVVVYIQKDSKTIELHCNQGASGCEALPPGNYTMVELPPNYGMYDCRNVEVYRGDPDKPEGAEKVGWYCLVGK
jgi:hypothetical protein